MCKQLLFVGKEVGSVSRNMFRDFEEDPFFSGHRERMRGMADTVWDPFGDLGPLALDSPRHPQDQRERHQQMRPGTRDIVPRDMFGGMFCDMHSMFGRMEKSFAEMANNPDAYSFSSSTMMSYTNDGHGDPKYYKASKSTKRAPGGIKETQKSVQDSATGVHKMAIGHHLGDRAHVMERSLNKKTNQEDRREDFQNMDESEAEAFNREWQQRTKHYAPASSLRHGYSNEIGPKYNNQLPDRAYHSRAARTTRDKDYNVRDSDVRKAGDRAGERKVRVKSRPSNKHSPRGGL